MASPLQPENPGLLSSILDWTDLLGPAVRNLLRGNLEGAGRNSLDFLGDIVDAPLPGDWIPHISKPEDKPEFSDLLGGMEPGFWKSATNLIGNTLTDPLTYIPGGLVVKGLRGAVGGVAAATRALSPALADSAKAGLINTKSALGWLEPSSDVAKNTIADANAAKSLYGKTALTGAGNVFEGVSPRIAQLADQTIGNYKITPSSMNAGMYEPLLRGSETLTAERQLADQLTARGGQDVGNLVPNITPELDYRKVRNAGERTIVDPLSESVGINGVAIPSLDGDVLDMVTKNPDRMFDQIFNAQRADNAASAAREHLGTEVVNPRFANGIDIANQKIIAPGNGMRGIPTFGPESKTVAREAATTRKSIDPLTGQVTTTPIIPRRSTDLPTSNLDAINSLLGGNAASMASVASGDLGRASKPMIKLEEQLTQWEKRISTLDATDAEKEQLRVLLPKYLEFSHNNFLEKTKDIKALSIQPGDDPLTMIPQDYAHRMLSGLPSESDAVMLGKNASSLKGRTLKDNEDFIDFMNANRGKGVTHEADLAKSTINLAAQQGNIAQRATVAKGLLGDEFTSLADKATGGKVSEALDAMKVADPEGHRILSTMWDGMEPRGPVLDMLSKANSVFKPAAVYGLVFPRVGGIMKNILSFPVQYGLEGEGKQAATQAARTLFTVYEALRQGTSKAFGLTLPTGELGKSIDLIEQSFKQAGGRAKNASEFLRSQGRSDLAGVIENGVADGFVSREAVENSIRESSWGRRAMRAIGMGDKARAKAFDLMEAPATAFQGAEQHARIGGYLDMLKRGKSPQEAAKAVRDSLYDYSVMTGANRTLRDLIPFAAFQTNAIRQSAKFLVKNPAAAVATSEIMGTGDNQDPVYPYMQGKTNIPLGADAAGNQTYLTGLGTPLEALGNIPNPSANLLDFGRDIERFGIGTSQPLIKSAYGITAGHDPMFETPYGSYSKVAGQDLGGVGRAYNLAAGTGLLQPVTSQIGQFQKLFDDKGTAGSDALDFLTGANSVSVDEDKAVQQQLQQVLARNPDAQKFTTLYSQSGDADTQALIHALADAKARVKARRLSNQPNQP